jgi:polyhydroxybutyrate depolymerase
MIGDVSGEPMPTRRSQIFTILIAACAAVAAARDGAAEVSTRTIAQGATTRSYVLYAPDDSRSGPRPLIVAMHGGMGTAQQMMRFSRFNALAAKEGFAVVYPQGISRRWNDGRIFRGRSETDADDVGFIRAVVADAAKTVPIDRGRIFATGISNGGFMSFRLACEAADLFRAIAPVTATMPDDLAPRCKPSAPIAVLLINGTSDPLVPYEGGHVRGPFNTLRGAIWSTDRTVGFWARHNRCPTAPVIAAWPDRDTKDGSRVIESDYRGCAGARVRLLRIEGGGHTWPGGMQYLPAGFIGATNRDFDATEAIWDFFNRLPPR